MALKGRAKDQRTKQIGFSFFSFSLPFFLLSFPPFSLPLPLSLLLSLSLSLSLSRLMMNLFEGHFLREQRLGCIFQFLFFFLWNGYYYPLRKSCTVRTSLVMTHYMFIFLHYSLTSWVLLSAFVGLFSGVWWKPFFALLKWNLAD